MDAITWKRNIPLRYEADIAVIGGGIAGVCAACAAARTCEKVVLVERFGVTGGVLTSGGVGNWCGERTGLGEVFEEIQEGLTAFGALGPERKEKYGSTSQVFDHEVLAIVLQELLLRRGVKLLLHTRFVDARVCDNGRITETIVCGASGPEGLRAEVWIDCSGESALAHQAGFSTMKGRPIDGLQLPMSMMFFVRETAEPASPQVPDGWFQQICSVKELPMTSLWPNGPRETAIKVKVAGYDSTDTESLAAAEIRARRRAMEVLDYYQRVEGRQWCFDHCSPVIGIREGRRILGDYVLTVDDVRTGRTFDDAVARGTYHLDAHKPYEDGRGSMIPEEQRSVPPYHIPVRALIARDGRNLLMAGRCISADQVALSSARVATTGAMTGQAAGTAAALCIQNRCDIRELDSGEIRHLLEKHGAVLEV